MNPLTIEDIAMVLYVTPKALVQGSIQMNSTFFWLQSHMECIIIGNYLI